jgi:hypothetical protein
MKGRRFSRALALTALYLACGIPLPIFAAESTSAFLPLFHAIEADSEVVWASDIVLTDSRLTYRQQTDPVEWDAAFSYASFDMDYEPYTPYDFFGFPEHLNEDRLSGLANIRYSPVDRITLLGTAGIYDGYPDYRRVWIANRYRQKNNHPDFPRIPGYKEPKPKGWNTSLGTRWEYIPLRAFAEVRLGYAFDQTAPGYEEGTNNIGDTVLIRGRDRLETETATLSSENVLTSWLRALNEFTFIHTTGREARFTYQGSLNVALSRWWFIRAYGGIATEDPQFDAYFVGGTSEWEALRAFFVSVTARYYEDTGEIENSLPTSAAPPLKSHEIGVGLRYMWGRSSLKVYVAAFWTDYGPVRNAVEFTHLYSDRHWGLAQIAYSLQF